MEAEVERLRKKVENYPSPSSYNRLAELLIGNGQVGDAESICKRSIRDFPRNGQAYVFLAEIERGRGRPEEAKGQLHRAVQNDRRCAPAFILLAELCQLEGSVTQAVEHLFPYFRAHPDKLPKQWRKDVDEVRGDETALARIVSDYISGMTDRFALQCHGEFLRGR